MIDRIRSLRSAIGPIRFVTLGLVVIVLPLATTLWADQDQRAIEVLAEYRQDGTTVSLYTDSGGESRVRVSRGAKRRQEIMLELSLEDASKECRQFESTGEAAHWRPEDYRMICALLRGTGHLGRQNNARAVGRKLPAPQPVVPHPENFFSPVPLGVSRPQPAPNSFSNPALVLASYGKPASVYYGKEVGTFSPEVLGSALAAELASDGEKPARAVFMIQDEEGQKYIAGLSFKLLTGKEKKRSEFHLESSDGRRYHVEINWKSGHAAVRLVDDE